MREVSHKYNIFLPRINSKNATANKTKKNGKHAQKVKEGFYFDFAFYISN